MEPREVEIDSLLRRSFADPIPTLSVEFEARLMNEVSLRSQPLGRYGQTLLAVYGLSSAVVCASIMHGQGLDWPTIATTIMAPLAVLAAAMVAKGRTFKRSTVSS